MKNKNGILNILNQIVELLTACNLEDKVTWFRAKYDRIKNLDPISDEYKTELIELKKILVGMGSFSDLPMYPKKKSRLSQKEARKMQWDLTEKLGEAIRENL